MNKTQRSRLLGAFLAIIVGVLGLTEAQAQMPARFYLKSLSDANAVPVIFNSISGNTNPFDPAHTVTPGAQFDASMALAGYAHTFALFDRAAMAAVILPMGRISGDVTVAGRTINQSASGFGDPMLEFTIDLIGPPARRIFPMRCATSPATRSTCSPTWPCRSASTTAASR